MTAKFVPLLEVPRLTPPVGTVYQDIFPGIGAATLLINTEAAPSVPVVVLILSVKVWFAGTAIEADPDWVVAPAVLKPGRFTAAPPLMEYCGISLLAISVVL